MTEETSNLAGTHLQAPKSSRIFIKNLPPTNFTDATLKTHFSTLKGTTITDCKFFADRRIAFIGYKTPEQAEAAVKYFDRSYIKTSRLSVEIAKSARSDNLGRPWSANIPGTTAFNKKHNIGDAAKAKSLKRKRGEVEPKSDQKSGPPVDENDPKYKEFMQLMKGSSQTKIWENETAIVTEETPALPALGGDEDEDSGSEYEDLSKFIAEKKKWKKEVPKEATPTAEEAPQPEGEADPEVLPDVTEEDNNGVSDLDWLKSMTSNKLEEPDDPIEEKADKAGSSDESGGLDGEGDAEMQDAPTEEPVDEKPVPKSEEELAVEKIMETGRLFVRNLTYSVTEEELEELFSPFGEIEEVHLPIDTKKNVPKGFAYIHFTNPEEAVTAFETLSQSIFQGRTLHIIPGEPKRTNQLDDFALSKLPLKKQKEILKKRAAAKSDFEWNALYMNINAVLASTAEKLGVSKADLLDPTSSDAAVKQAHAETRVIQDTKKFFEQHGINLAAFSKKKRGDKILLLKNFAYGTSVEELKALCSDSGGSDVKRVLMPPTGTIAIVEFKDDPSGRAAFTRLYGRKFKDSILKIEKGPVDLFTNPIDPTKPAPTSSSESQLSGVVGKTSIKDLISAGDDDNAATIPGETTSLFVKNLSFSTTSDKLKGLFSPMEGFIAARVKTRPDPKNVGQTLSMGYGFVEFRTKQAAQAATATLNGQFLDGHKLDIRESHRGEDAASERKKLDAQKNAASTKIIIKNLAFEVSEKQIRSLFGQYGKLRSVRVPKKFNRTSRGFGFAQFVSTREAESAMEALRHTHLHGRPLVLEWAKEDAVDAEEEIERLQKKVKGQANSVRFAQLSGAAGRKKFDIEETSKKPGRAGDEEDDGDD